MTNIGQYVKKCTISVRHVFYLPTVTFFKTSIERKLLITNLLVFNYNERKMEGTITVVFELAFLTDC